MDRHYKVIFEALLSILILIELLMLIIISIGFTAGINVNTVYSFGIWDLIIGILILFDFVLFRIVGKNQNKWDFIQKNWVYPIAVYTFFLYLFQSIPVIRI